MTFFVFAIQLFMTSCIQIMTFYKEGAFPGGKICAGVQEQDGCNHGVVAVPGAVLFRKMMRQNVPTFTWLRVRFEPATH